MNKVSVILPICNELENIHPLVEDLNRVLCNQDYDFEIICVDDGSKDGSRKLLIELASKMDHLKVILFRRNYGQTAAFDAGFRAAGTAQPHVTSWMRVGHGTAAGSNNQRRFVAKLPGA